MNPICTCVTQSQINPNQGGLQAEAGKKGMDNMTG